MPKPKTHLGIEVRVETKKTVHITLSQDRADCIAAQLDGVLGGEVDPDEFADLHDFIEMLNAVTHDYGGK